MIVSQHPPIGYTLNHHGWRTLAAESDALRVLRPMLQHRQRLDELRASGVAVDDDLRQNAAAVTDLLTWFRREFRLDGYTPR